MDQGQESSVSDFRRRTWWQFSLRELFLLMLALGAMLALWVLQSSRYTTTEFFQTFDGRATIKSVAEKQDVKVKFVASERGGSGIAPATQTIKYSLESPAGTKNQIVNALCEEIQHRLEKDGCYIHSGGTGYLSAGTSEYKIGYRRGRTEGFVGGYSISGSGNIWTLLIVIHEFPARP